MTLSREPVGATPRRPMTRARRARIWLRDKGLCGECGTPVPMRGTTIDHRIALHHGGPDTDGNLRFLCRGCELPKNAADATISAHIRRLIRKADPAQRKVKRPIRGRKLSDSPLRRKFDGTVEARR